MDVSLDIKLPFLKLSTSIKNILMKGRMSQMRPSFYFMTKKVTFVFSHIFFETIRLIIKLNIWPDGVKQTTLYYIYSMFQCRQ